MSNKERKDARRQQQKPAFVAHVYEEDYREIQKLVKQYPEIETGGDLFGLWKDEKTVIIQLFIGPGKNCERTTTSFHQDIEYLHRVGSVITTEEGLCNVGEWHSHHQIGMPKPSGADRRTVFNNMPHLGLERFVLFIASIESSVTGGKSHKRPRDVKLGQIVLRPFLFVGSTQDIVEGEIETIPGPNPHSLNSRAVNEIAKGAERPPNTSAKLEDDRFGSVPHEPIKKKPGKKGPGKAAESQTEKPGATLQQQADARQSAGSKDYVANEHQSAGKGRDGEGNPTQRRDDLRYDENQSPNTGSAAPSSQSTHSFPPISHSDIPQHSGPTQGRGRGTQGNMPSTTSPPSPQLWQVWNNSQQPGKVQGRGRGTQENVSQSAYPPTSQMSQPLNTSPHPSAAQQRRHDPQRNTPPSGGGGYSGSQGQQYPSSTQQRNRGSTRDQYHDQGSMQHQSHATQYTSETPPVNVTRFPAKGFF